WHRDRRSPPTRRPHPSDPALTQPASLPPLGGSVRSPSYAGSRPRTMPILALESETCGQILLDFPNPGLDLQLQQLPAEGRGGLRRVADHAVLAAVGIAGAALQQLGADAVGAQRQQLRGVDQGRVDAD